MTATIIAVTFETDAQRHRDGQFSIPKKVCDLLGLQSGDEIQLLIEGAREAIVKKLSSGFEIYGADIEEYVKAGDRIRVTASRP